ncbi:MAG: hypothetical protein Q9170_003866 [Blastenia crenularia]
MRARRPGSQMPQPCPPIQDSQKFSKKLVAAPRDQWSEAYVGQAKISDLGTSIFREAKPTARSLQFKSRFGNARADTIPPSKGSISSINQKIEPSAPASKENSSTTGHQRSDSQLSTTADLPASKSAGLEAEVPKHGLRASHYSKPSNLPLRKPRQQPARSASSLHTSNVGSMGSNDALSEDTREIQRELLHLHVLHVASASVYLQWRGSANMKIQKQFDNLVERHTEIADITYQTQELKNRSALIEWSSNTLPSEVERRVRTLSRCIEEVYENLGVGGKYHHVTSSFEAWYTRAREIQASRKANVPTDVADLGYVEEIGAGWQNDVDVVQRRLSNLTGDLRTLGSASLKSNLGQLLVLLQDLIIDLLTEVDCIRSIEYELITQEEMWIEEQIRSLSIKVHKEMGENRKTPGKGRSNIN